MDFFIGLDLGGTNLKYAIGDRTGNVIIKKSKPSLSKESQEKIFNNIFSAVNELQQEFNSEIIGIAVGTPGCVDFAKGQLIGQTPNLVHWTNAPIKKRLQEKFNTSIWVDNDANLMALAETRIGAAKDYTNVLCVTIGTGIGGGIVLDNKLYRGSNYAAAEIGHITVEMNGKPCNCGNLGCLEAYTAAPAMVDRYYKKLQKSSLLIDKKKISTKFIFQKAAVAEDLAIQTINETCDYLGTGIASIVNIINPQIVVIGGGVAEAGENFIKRIEKIIRQKAMKANTRALKVTKAKLGSEAGVVGAILLAAEN